MTADPTTQPGITPFTVDIAASELADLHRRLDDTRWPDQLPGVGWTQGAPTDYVQPLAHYWRNFFDWEKQQAYINSFPQFTTEIDGTNVHFITVRSERADATPLLLIHGWPGSIIEYLDLIGPLTTPQDDRSPAFHVVLPSLPGYTFSGPVPDSGWHSARVAAALTSLMDRLGYQSFVVHGGDWGERIGRDVAIGSPDKVSALHITTFFCSPPYSGTEGLDELTPQEQEVLVRHQERTFSIAYFHLLSERPQTVAYGWSDSPVSLLAWMAEKFAEWTDWVDSPQDAVSWDKFLTNVSMYWFTNTANSAGRLYWEQMQSGAAGVPDWNPVPTGAGVFPREMSVPIRSLVARTNNVVYWAEYDRGGHFAALEEPDLVVADLRAFVASL